MLSQTLQSLNAQDRFDIVNILLRYGLWFVSVLILFMAARLLRGKKHYTTTLRVAGFAQSAHILELLGFLPVIGPLARIMALLLTIFGVWVGTAAAHELSGWRTVLLPVLYIITTVVGVAFLYAAIQGTAFAVDSLLVDFGLSGQ